MIDLCLFIVRVIDIFEVGIELSARIHRELLLDVDEVALAVVSLSTFLLRYIRHGDLLVEKLVEVDLLKGEEGVRNNILDTILKSTET